MCEEANNTPSVDVAPRQRLAPCTALASLLTTAKLDDG